jgi:hypothetical protein
MSRWIYKGINYFQYATLDTVQKIVFGGNDDDRNDRRPDSRGDNLSDSEKEAFKEHSKAYKNWIKTEEKVEFSDQTIDMTDNRGSVRKCIYGMIEEENPNFYYVVAENPKNWREKTITVHRATKEEGAAFREAQDKKKRDEFDRILGFSKVWKELINFKKPVIGHNLYLDLLFSFEHYHGNNPFTFGRFKENVNECWPNLYDTKVLSSEFGREDIGSKMNLEELYTKLQEITQISVSVGKGFTDYASGSADTFHDAGYDAFVTGSCYYMLSKLDGSTQIFKDFVNKVRLGTSRMFLADFGTPDNDVVTADVGRLHPENVHHRSHRKAQRQRPR